MLSKSSVVSPFCLLCCDHGIMCTYALACYAPAFGALAWEGMWTGQ